VGDDRLQRRAGGGVDPDSFTHGTSAERRRWFDTGAAMGIRARASRSQPTTSRS
jgi:predicted metalloprotease